MVTPHTMHRTLSFGIVAVLLATVVGGALTPASAAIYNPLVCSPSYQYATSGQWVTFSAYYQYGEYNTGTLTWSAVGGSPSYGTGATFGTQFWTSSINETRHVTVTDGYRTATCTVYLTGTPTPTPAPQALGISPTSRTIASGESITFSAWGGDGTYSWSAPSGIPQSGWGSSFTTAFTNYGSNTLFQEVRVTSGGTSVYAWVTVTPSWTPTPSPWYGNVTVDHTVRNVTRGGSESTWVSAQNGDRLQFTVRLTTGSAYAEDVHVRDWLPQYVTYIPGSTTLDGVWHQDGVTTGNSNDSLALGQLSPNRTYVLRFDATVNGAPNVTLTNSVNVHARGFTDQNRTSTIAVSGSTITPTPTPTWGGDGVLALSLAGRNVTRGQSGERTSLAALGGDTLDLILHVKSQNGQYLSNIVVTNYLPMGINYIPGSTVLNGRVTGDGITSSGLNIGTLAPWQEATVKFSVRVDGAYVPTVGRTVITDSAQARADNTSSIGASITLTLGTLQVISSASGVKTGPVDSLAIALALALLTTGAYAFYTRTGTFNRRMAVAEVNALDRRPLDFSR